MSFVEDTDLVAAIAESERLTTEGRIYAAFTTMNKAITKNFTLIGFIKASINLFEVIDQYSENTPTCETCKTQFVKSAYEDVHRMTCLAKNKPQMHFWAGCVKICQFRNEGQLRLITKINNLEKAHQHFQCAIDNKPDHILAPYLITACESAYLDLSGTVLCPVNSPRNPDVYYQNTITQQPANFLCLSFIMGKFMYYLQQYYLAECYLNMALCRTPKSDLEDHLSNDSLIILNEIADWKVQNVKSH